ncbi:hypothetical protein COCON_G00215200 [Conger conger]|uniref:C-type lectin domain-containing protein n=1 Tax=Conger conger TaxID=82655 RepID=A0A9Q1CXW5_CONCO|nr:IgGFc-binding protein-like [Conger conger]KAJ8252208.1 hypothetical protein COCON_G00215200 [Conger conger]
MWLTRSWMVAVFILASLSTGFCSSMSAGTEFITAFMENVAHYRIRETFHKLLISALTRNTKVNIAVQDRSWNQTLIMNAGNTRSVDLPSELQLIKFNTSYKTVRVTSTFPVTVLSISLTSASTDTSRVLPVQNLGKEYRLASPAGPSDGSYRFVVINTQLDNTVTISQSSQELFTVTLGPYENAQFQSAKHPATTLVTAQTPVAVLFGHPCIQQVECKCGLAFEQLSPVSSWGTVFIVPYLSVSNRRNQTLLLVTSDGAAPESILPSEFVVLPRDEIPVLMDGSLYIRASVPVSVSLLQLGAMTLIPEESFSTCYLVHAINYSHTYFLIVVKTAEKDGVRLGHSLLPSVDWAEVAGSDYSVGLCSLAKQNMHRVIWHRTSKMAVYVFGRYDHMYFGSPALSLKVEPDGSKCRAYAGVVELVLEKKSWTDAQERCWNLNSQLASFNSLSFLEHAVKELGDAHRSTAWMGLRRSLLSGEWRWLNREPMGYSKWGSGEPNSSLTTQCAMTSLEPVKSLTWSAMSCCNQLPFICFMPGADMPFP